VEPKDIKLKQIFEHFKQFSKGLMIIESLLPR